MRASRSASVKRHGRRAAELLDDRRRRAVGDHPPAVHDHDAVAEALGLLDVVGDEHDGGAGVADVADDVPGVAAGEWVEVLGELVEEDDLGTADEGQSDEQPLPLAAGERTVVAPQQRSELPLLDQLAGRARGRVQGREQVQRLTDPHPVGQRGVLQLGTDASAQPVPVHGGVEAEDPNGAAVGAAKALEDLDGGRLAGAVGAEESEQLAPMDGERDAAHDLGRPVALHDPVDGHDGFVSGERPLHRGCLSS